MATNSQQNKPVEHHVPFYRIFSEWLRSSEVLQEQENTPLDLVQVVSVLKACGFVLQNVMEDSTTSANSGYNHLSPVGCSVNVRCPRSKLNATLCSNESDCFCPKKAPNWSVTWAGAVAGEAQLEIGRNNTPKASLIPELEPGKIELIKDVMNLLFKYIWPECFKVDDLKKRRPYRSLEHLTAEPPINVHHSPSVPNICIQSIQMNNIQTSVSTIYNNFNLINPKDLGNLPKFPGSNPTPAPVHEEYDPPPVVPQTAGLPPASTAPAGPQLAVNAPAGHHSAITAPTGHHPAITAPAGHHPAITAPAGHHPAITAPAGHHPAITAPAGHHPAITAPAGPPLAITAPAGPPLAITAPAGPPLAITAPAGPPLAITAPAGPPLAITAPAGPPLAITAPAGPPLAITAPAGHHPAITAPAGHHPAITAPAGHHPAITAPAGPQRANTAPAITPPAITPPTGPPPVVRKSAESKFPNELKSKPQRLSLPDTKSRFKSPVELQEKILKDEFMQSSMMRGKRYAETLKQRNLRKF